MADDLAEDRAAFEAYQEADRDNRDLELEDIRFVDLPEQYQWPPEVREARDRDQRPSLTINRLPAFIRQVTNDARQNKPQMKAKPVDDVADPDTAEVITGLLRNIEVSSNADIAYDTALTFAAKCGRGYFTVDTDYASDDTFDLDLVIKRVANPFAIYGDPYSVEADSSDWMGAFEVESIPRSLFRQKYKGAEETTWDAYDGLSAPWCEDKNILICKRWVREEVSSTALMLINPEGQTRVVREDVYEARKQEFDFGQWTVEGQRPIKSHKVRWKLMTGAEELDRGDWAGRYIPIIPVYGDEVNVEGKRYFRSLIRDAKDPQRMFNYWRSAGTELVALAPKAPFVGPVGAFNTDQSKWDTANSESHAYIEFDPVPGAPNGGMPQRQPFAGVPAGVLQEALNASDDMKAIMGIHDASLGAQGNETSGRAIIARQREGDVSNFHFTDNLSRAIRHAGRVLLDLIPVVYSGERVLRVLGPEDQPVNVKIGRAAQAPQPLPGQEPAPLSRIYDLGVGKYDLVVDVGPSFTTRREEAASQMIELIRAFPAAAPVVGDMLARNLDWPGADEIADRLQALLPPNLQEGEQNAQLQQAQAMIQQLQAQLQQLSNDAEGKARELSLKEYEAETKRFEAQTDRLEAQARLRQPVVASQPAAA